MSSTWGNHLKLSIFGESHGKGIGVVLDGLPAGQLIDHDELLAQMARRAPGRDSTSTARKESDFPEILSGLYQNTTTGTPLTAVIRNRDTHSGDYADLNNHPRPGHADFTGNVRYSGHNDYRGGGHFSGRLTAPLTFAGAVCRQILARRGISIGAHLFAVGAVRDEPFNPMGMPDAVLDKLASAPFPTLSPDTERAMRQEIETARLDGDSVGGIVECMVTGLPVGIGDPMFGGVENRMASILFGIPAVKGVEFGDGFGAAALRGSVNNDAFVYEQEQVRTATNHHGGILGGITSGMPLMFRVAFKPTPSIFKEQQTVDLQAHKETPLTIHGRHDPCVAVRAVPVVEAAAATALLDLLLEAYGYAFR